MLDRPTLVTHVLPTEGRHILLEVAAAIAGVEAKMLRSDLSELGISSRDRLTARSGHPTRAILDRIARQLGVGEIELAIAPSVTRTRVLAHLVDVSDASGRPDPVEDFKVINNELASFGNGLDEKPMIVVATKIDAASPEKLKRLSTYAKRRKLEFHAISAVTGEGVDALRYALGRQLAPQAAAD